MNKRDHVLNGVVLAVGVAIVLGIAPSAGAGADARTLPSAPLDALAAVGLLVAEFFVPVVLGALFPDVDTAFGKHRKTLHNGFVVAVFVAYPFVFDNLHFVWLGVASHLVLDVAGSARGIALFYPLTSEEYDLPGGVSTSSRYATPLTVAITLAEVGLIAAVHYYVVPLDTAGQTIQQVAAQIGALL
ncbi:MAG: metal-dependent hydrolase [Haloferacaceae archaeon]